ncbi:MAG: hypothetical protein JJV93_02635 [Alphaproteobacteria bacterium]|nr:hypothetical protein [Alphaproteobacteria bacterium]MBL0718126.1 hypothetical protein [Alphaproteobacteria bacterium]
MTNKIKSFTDKLSIKFIVNLLLVIGILSTIFFVISNINIDSNQLSFFGWTAPTGTFPIVWLSIIIGLLDGFNPCELWVLAFLVGVLSQLGNYKRMLLVIGVFLTTSMVSYYIMLLSLLKAQQWVLENAFIIRILHIAIGILSLVVALTFAYHIVVNYMSQCNMISIEKKNKLDKLANKIGSSPTVSLSILAGIIGLSLSLTMVELLCSIQLPLIYTSVLATLSLPSYQYYLQLLLYDIAFMTQNFIVFFIALKTLKTASLHKLDKPLKWIGMIVMFMLGIIIIFKPDLLAL